MFVTGSFQLHEWSLYNRDGLSLHGSFVIVGIDQISPHCRFRLRVILKVPGDCLSSFDFTYLIVFCIYVCIKY